MSPIRLRDTLSALPTSAGGISGCGGDRLLATSFLILCSFLTTACDGGSPTAPGASDLGLDQFVLIQPGTFQMGSAAGSEFERPVHSVTITTPFRLQKTEVTQGQWKAVMGRNPSVHSSCGITCPVDNVSWYDTQAFLQKLNAANPGANYRLPTEAEWEYAARAGTTGEWGGTGDLSNMGWYDANSGIRSHPAAQLRANAWGLFDMHGNVWEWVQDQPESYGAEPVSDPLGASPGSYRMLRGGTFLLSAALARSAHRDAALADFRDDDYGMTGFRLARSVPSAIAPATKSRLLFVLQPSASASGQPIAPAVQVAVKDALGNTVTTATDAVTLTLGANPDGGTLSGTLTVAAIQGIATFGNVWIERTGIGYTLVASASQLSGATSTSFTINSFIPLTLAAAGANHTCGVAAGGAAYCWGSNDQAQLGDGTTTSRSSPVLVLGGASFAAMRAGAYHNCGVTTAGATRCWGYNDYGQLGDGTTGSRARPVLVAGGVSFAALSAGGYHTCGVTAAGAAYCWGRNEAGQLGDGTTTDRSSPVRVAGGVSFATVSAGGYHTCAVTAAGAAYCWGNNQHSQLGDGTTTDRSSPVLVAGGVSFGAVSAGGWYHTCGVTAAGAAYCWGGYSSGELGDGTIGRRSSPALVAGSVIFAAVSAGGYHSCGVTGTGVAHCWGNNGSGELGDGTTFNRSSPGLVAGRVTFGAVSAGGVHTCGVTGAGVAYCWGNNGSGRLGDGTITGRRTPVLVAP